MASGAVVAIYESSHFLNASLSFSPACLTLPFTWSALPSACSLSLPLTLPTVSFSFPFACGRCSLPCRSLSCLLLVLGCEKGDGPFGAGLHTGSPVFSAAVLRTRHQRSADVVVACRGRLDAPAGAAWYAGLHLG